MKKTILAALVALTAIWSAQAQTKYVMTVNLNDGTEVKYDVDDVQECEFMTESDEEASKPSVGDYFYSDGTWSGTIKADKTLIGIVFWLGDPTKDDAKLKAEHPECTHGLVIALKQKVSPWQSNFEGYGATKRVSDWLTENGYPTAVSGTGNDAIMNKTVGYSYTSYIEAFNADAANAAWPVNAVQTVVNYRKEVPAPANTSDWYLGSPREMVYACFGNYTGNVYTMGYQDPVMRDMLEAIFAQIEGAQSMLDEDENGYSFWTPMEYEKYPSNAYNVYFNRNHVPVSASYKSWSEYARVRPILAF